MASEKKERKGAGQKQGGELSSSCCQREGTTPSSTCDSESNDCTGTVKQNGRSQRKHYYAIAMAKEIAAVKLEGFDEAATSQTDSRYGVLLGKRKGDRFYCFDGVVLDADENAAQNILARLRDSEIGLWTPFRTVRKVLLERTERFNQRLGLLNQDSSCIH